MKTFKDYISINESKVKTNINKYDYIGFKIPEYETEFANWWGIFNADEFTEDTTLSEMFSEKTFNKLLQLSKNESIIITEEEGKFLFYKLR